MAVIASVMARVIKESRGQPTIEVTITDEKGRLATASLPAGSSLGKYEVPTTPADQAVEIVNKQIGPALLRKSFATQAEADKALQAYNTSNDKKAGTNTVLCVSLALARLFAQQDNKPLYQYIKEISGTGEIIMARPMFNLINGAKHADNNLDFQEYMILPIGMETFHEKLMAGRKIFNQLGRILKEHGHDITIGYEGGYAPNLNTNEEGLGYLVQAITESGFVAGQDVVLGLDIAASNLSPMYPAKVENYLSLFDNFPLYSIEDPFNEDKWDEWKHLKEALVKKQHPAFPYFLVGDDLFVGPKERFEEALHKDVANTALFKINQASTLSELIDEINQVRNKGYYHILSHRSGETLDSFVSDLAVGTGAIFIKAGAPNEQAPERMVKYERLSEIEAELALAKNGHA